MLQPPDDDRRRRLREAFQRFEESTGLAHQIIGVVFIGIGAGALDPDVMNGIVETFGEIPGSIGWLVELTRSLDIPDHIVAVGLMASGGLIFIRGSRLVRRRNERMDRENDGNGHEV